MLRKKNIEVVWVDNGVYIMFKKSNLKCLECVFGKFGQICSYRHLIDERTIYDICKDIGNYFPIANPKLLKTNK